MRKLHLVAIPLLVGLSVAACGSDPESPSDFHKGGTVEPGGPTEQPSFTPVAYPAGPYGVEKGSVVANYEMLGWHAPVDRGYDVNQFEKVSFADFYNPDGTKPYKLIFLNSSAVWCSVCNAEFNWMKNDQTWSKYRPVCVKPDASAEKGTCSPVDVNGVVGGECFADTDCTGAVFISSLFEDAANPPKPANPTNLQGWGEKYAVEFPMMLDPGFKFGEFFTADATPMNLIIDTRTMVIKEKILGGDITAVLAKIDQFLAE